jgi:hypothetical protein
MLTVIVVTVFECHRTVVPGMIEIWPSSSAAERAEGHSVLQPGRLPRALGVAHSHSKSRAASPRDGHFRFLL